PGENVIAADATNWPDAEHGRGTEVKGANPAAFVAWVGGFRDGRTVWGVGTDASWLWSKDPGPGWNRPEFRPGGWRHAVELPEADGPYAGVARAAAPTAPGRSAGGGRARAVLPLEAPLPPPLGRTNRERVVPRRDQVATTLQALELNNGATL